MKQTKLIQLTMMAGLLVLASGVASAQSLGDYARTVRMDKSEPAPATRHFDNDNLPTTDALSVVGPAPETTPAADAKAVTVSNATDPKAGDPKAADARAGDPKAASATQAEPKQAAADKSKEAEEMKKKIDEQQAKINSLNREVDLDQREERLRAAAYYQDAGSRLRNPAEWNKEQSQNQSDAAEKQKALDAARQKLDEMQEQARKAGIPQKDKDKDASDNK